MDKFTVIEEHECEILRKFNSELRKQEITIQKLSDMGWYWVRWSDKENIAEGIGYCPYCGEKLNQ